MDKVKSNDTNADNCGVGAVTVSPLRVHPILWDKYGIEYPPFSYATVHDYLSTITTVEQLNTVVDRLAGRRFSLIQCVDRQLVFIDGDAFKVGNEVYICSGGVTHATMAFMLEAAISDRHALSPQCVIIRTA